MIRLFNVYYPARALVLLLGEALVVWVSFLIGIMLQYREDSYLVLNFEFGYYKLVFVTATALVFCHWLDLYDLAQFDAEVAYYLRLLLVPGLIALTLAAVRAVLPGLMLGRFSFLLGLVILSLGLVAWRSVYTWLSQLTFLQQRVYVLGAGERAARLVRGLQKVPQLGIDVVGWSGNLSGEVNRESLAADLLGCSERGDLHRVIVAMDDRRQNMPMVELLQLRLRGVQIEDATSWLEKISGKIEIDQLHPSWIIFTDGFSFGSIFRFLRHLVNFLVAFIGLLLALPILPCIAIAIKLDSPGPLFYAQKRVGRIGREFYCYKFRTMRADSEADTGPTWALDNDPRITRVGKFLRSSRLDEIPQMWCVLKGDMAFVGPRPERPEFVQWLSQEIPYYRLRELVRPGITGWAQIRYKYGNTVEDSKQKLQYDLFYVKNASLALDILIMMQTIKIVTLGRGAQ